MSEPHEIHNQLAREFIVSVGRGCRRPDEVMVVLESVIMAGMVLLNKQYRIPPSSASVAVEEAVMQALARFAKTMQK